MALAVTRQGRWAARYRQAFAGPVGEQVRDDLFKFCKIGSPTHVIGDPVETAFNEGMRRVGLRIAAFLNMDERAMLAAAMTANPDQDDTE